MRGAFTLMETLLAAALGSLVLLVVAGLVTVMDRADTGSVDRLARTSEMEQAQTVIRRAIGSLAMAGGNAPAAPQRNATERGEDEAEPPTTALVTYTPTPRMVLAPMSIDPMLAAQTAVGVATTTTGTDSTISAGGELSVEEGGAQRLQIALTSLPLPEQAFVTPASIARNTRRALNGGQVEDETDAEAQEMETPAAEDLTEDPSAEEDEESDEAASELVPIFWGVFELTPPGPASSGILRTAGAVGFSADAEAERSREGWTLWWRRIEPPVNPSAAALIGAAALMTEDEAASSGATPTMSSVSTTNVSSGILVDPRLDPTAVPLIRGLEMCRWSVYRGRALLPGYAATYSGELPAYVQLEVRTTSGVYANWMFEVGWATVREPGQVEASRLNQAILGRGGGLGGEGGERRGGRGRNGGVRTMAPDSEGPVTRQRRDGRPVPDVQRQGPRSRRDGGGE